MGEPVMGRGVKRLPFARPSARGLLIVVEGVPRAGKSTLVGRLVEALGGPKGPPLVLDWNSHPEVQPITKAMKDRRALTPHLFHLTHLLDFAARYEEDVRPALDAGRVVVADRYLYTSLVRDGLRGVPGSVVAAHARYFAEPHVAALLDPSPSTVMARYDGDPTKFGHYGCGLDLFPGVTHRVGFARYVEAQRRAYRTVAAAHGMDTYEDGDAAFHAIVRRVAQLSP